LVALKLASGLSSMNRKSSRHARSAGVTLLELMTVVVIIAILATMLMPVIANVIARMERARCTMNLKGLYVGAEGYLQEHLQWPQISTVSMKTQGSDEYAVLWMEALKPYKISEESWHCPTVQKIVAPTEAASKVKQKRIDYLPCPFDEKQITPHRWSGQPWFIERGAVHDEGNLIIFSDGSIRAITEMTMKAGKGAKLK